MGLEQPGSEEAEGRLKDGGGGLAGAELVLRPPGSSGSGLQQHQELCGCARGSEGNAPLREQRAVHGVRLGGGGANGRSGCWDSLQSKHQIANGTNPSMHCTQPVAGLLEVIDPHQKSHHLYDTHGKAFSSIFTKSTQK